MSLSKKEIRKKILYMSPLPPPSGGIATWTEKLVKYGLPDGFEIEIVNINTLGNRKMHEKKRYESIELKRNIGIIYNLIKQITIFRPHIVHLNCSLSPAGVFRDYLCALIIKCSSIKLITHYRGNVIDFSKTSFRRLSFAFLCKLIKISNVNISLNKPSYDFINTVAHQNKADKHYQLPNYIDDYFFQSERPFKSSSNKNPGLRAIYVGAFSQAKGAHDIVRIAKIFKDDEFVLIGNVSDEFTSLMKRLPGNLAVIHPATHKNVLEELKRSDFLLFPSHSEGFPNAVLEAMAMGLPVIATCVGAIPEMIDEGRGGFLCSPGNHDQLVEAIDRLKNLPDITELGHYNFEKARRNYSYSTVIGKLCNIYENIL